ncbi:MAG: phosphotransferase [Candidatus Hatepunaea meridiana]|nr:phosphotransferase [Candidatus Hatepunaea meridiana]
MKKEQIDWLKERFPFDSIGELPIYGSLRRFYRIFSDTGTRVVILDDNLEQLRLFINRAKLFSSLNVNVPQIYDYSEELHLILEEDLGDDLLEDIINETDDKIPYYKKVIDLLVGWQKRFDKDTKGYNTHKLPLYDFDFAYNETTLFINRYLRRYLDISCLSCASLKPHFVDLAERSSQIRKTLMHRDFQARNIMWHKNQPYFVDFQTAMLGPYTYDLTALLYDNHVELRVDQKESLIDYFYEYYPGANRDDFYPVALQRTLQAISAYAFLSKEQGKKQYEQYIPRGLKHLEELSGWFGWAKVILEEVKF